MLNLSQLKQTLSSINQINTEISDADKVRTSIVSNGKLPKMSAMKIAVLNSPQGKSYSITFADGSNLQLAENKYSVSEIEQNFGVDLPDTIQQKEKEKSGKTIQNFVSSTPKTNTTSIEQNNSQYVIKTNKRYDFYFSKNSITQKFLAIKNQQYTITGYQINVHNAVETNNNIVLSLTIKSIPNNANTVQVGFIAAAAIVAGLSVITGITAIVFLEKIEESPIVAISILPLVIGGFILARKLFA